MGTLAVVELPMKSGLPRDKVVNTFAFAESPALAQGTKETVYPAALNRLYNLNNAALGGVALSTYFSKSLSRAAGACAIKLYDITDHLDGSPHGSPYFTGTMTLQTEGTDLAMPDEVALVCTLEAKDRALQFVERADGADPGSAPDRPRQRYTGRVYLGPWTTGATVNDASSSARPKAVVTQAVRELMKDVADYVDTNTGDLASLGVWSRADRAIRGLSHVRTDDAWDTQRRRGVAPLAITRLATADAVPEIELGA